MIVIGGIAAINAVTIGCSVSPALRDAVASLGVDATFTNRTDIWQIGTGAVAEKPLTDTGFSCSGRPTSWSIARGAGRTGLSTPSTATTPISMRP